MKTCSFEGCERKILSKNLCATHYRMRLSGKELKPINEIGQYPRDQKNKRMCSFDGCINLHRAKGYCSNHYNKLVNKKPIGYISPEAKKCSINNCPDFSLCKGLCSKHYRAQKYIPISIKKIIDPNAPIKKDAMNKKPCEIDNCDNKAKSKGYCSKHYARLVRYGDVHVNYSRKNKRTVKNITNNTLKFTHSHEEVMILNEFFNEAIGYDRRYDFD